MPKWMTLFEYLLAFATADEAAEIRALGEKYDLAMTITGDQPAAAAKLRFREIELRYGPQVLAQLRSGALVARGFAAGASLDSPPAIIRAEWWEGPWTLDYYHSSANENGHKISRIRVCRAEDLDREEAPQVRPDTQRRLVIRNEAQLAIIDGVEKRIPQQPFKLLVMLAQAAMNNDPFLTVTKLEDAFTRRRIPNLVHDLKLALVGRQDEHLKGIIENRRSPSAYRLVLARRDIEILA